MVRKLIPAVLILILLSSCSSLKQLGFNANTQIAAPATGTPANTHAKFIDGIAVSTPVNSVSASQPEPTKTAGITETKKSITDYFNARSNDIAITPVQIKYAILLDTEAEYLGNKALLEGVDEWYGTRYRMGGTTKKGVDCSAFVGAVYAGVFGIALPRTARDQYKMSRRISRTELKEGDLLFFNTRGGISHVGIYLHNNKFVHASVSRGVTVDDLFDPYYIKRFVAAGRVEKPTAKTD